MSSLKWEERFSVRIPEIDEQHKGLFNLINRLDGLVRTGAPKAEVDEVIEGLIDYTKTHFLTEQTLMIESHYPAYPEHVAAHNDFVLRVIHFKQDIESGKAWVPEDTLQFATNWLFDHILIIDKAFGNYLLHWREQQPGGDGLE